MALGLVLPNNASLDLLGLVFVIETEEDKAKSTATLGQLLAHDDSVLHLAKLLEVRLQVLLRG